MSTSAASPNGLTDAHFRATSADGSRVFFETDEALDPADTDGVTDVYERSNGATTLLSTGPAGGNGPLGATFMAASQTGTRVFFVTTEPLVAADTDSSQDLYERSGGVTTLVSTGPTGGNGAFGATYAGSSTDGTRVFFTTRESLVSADTDTQQDVYQRSSGTTTLLSTGPVGGNGPIDAFFAGASADGSRVFLHTDEILTSDDTDAQQDVYEHSGGTTTRLSFGPIGGNGGFEDFYDSYFVGCSTDGTHVFFTTDEALVSTDTDDVYDVYERSGGVTTLLTTGPAGGNAPNQATFVRASDDGSKVFFQTSEPLVASDLDTADDVYQRSGGVTTLISTAPGDVGGILPASFVGATPDGSRVFFTTALSLLGTDQDGGWRDVYQRLNGVTTLLSVDTAGSPGGAFNAAYAGASQDGSRVFFTTLEHLAPTDTDSSPDLYERSGAATTLISIGPAGGNSASYTVYNGASQDGSRAFFSTSEGLVASDTDGGGLDVYKASVVHEAPATGSPISVSLVPVFRQCGTGANPVKGRHSAPFSLGSCLPPATTGVAHVGPQAVGSVQLAVVPGNLTTVADEADIAYTGNLGDVRATSTSGPDYNPNATGPDLTLVSKLRITDLASGPSQTESATDSDLDFAVPIDCVGTAGGEGANCTVNSSADAVLPGAIAEGRSTVIQSFRVRVNDSGANGVRGDGDDRLFEQQGYYVP